MRFLVDIAFIKIPLANLANICKIVHCTCTVPKSRVSKFRYPALSTKPTDGVLILKKLGDYRPLIPRYYMHRTTTLGSSPLEKQVFTNQ